MIHSTTFLKRDHHLLYTNFTKSNTMEGKKGGHPTQGAQSLSDLKKVMTALTTKESLSVTGGGDSSDELFRRTVERDRWNNHCGGIVPQ
jgi:hypothetical protein